MYIINRYIFILFSTIALSACISNNYIANELRDYASSDNSKSFKTSFSINETFKYKIRKLNSAFTLHVAKGIFTSKYKTDEGMLYQGSRACISIYDPYSEHTISYDGGFFIPFDIHTPVRIWRDRSTRDERNRNGIKVKDSYYLDAHGFIMGHDRTGIVLSPAISEVNDRKIKMLSGNTQNTVPFNSSSSRPPSIAR